MPTADSPTGVLPVEDVHVVPACDWDATMAELGAVDTYLLRAHHEVSAQLEPPGTRPVLLRLRLRGGDVGLPLLLRPLADGSGWDATTPYGYGGPVARGRPDAAAFGRALDAWARRNDVVTTFLRLHPLVGDEQLIPPSADLQTPGATVAWDVSGEDDLTARMHPHHRRATRRAVAAGVNVSVDPAPSSLRRFRAIYEETMRRQGAAPFFYFPDAYWDAVLAHAAELEPVLVEGWLDGAPVASLLCFAKQPWLHYHLGGSTDVGRRIGASNRCFLAAAEWARSHGLRGFHLGGGVGGASTSSLFVFKQRFDPAGTPRPFRIAKLVHDRERYAELAGTDSTSGFFPPWRRPEPPPGGLGPA